jgi:predicted porin
MSAISGGIRIDFGGFRVSGSVKYNDDVYANSTATTAFTQPTGNTTSDRSLNGLLFDVGARYKMGANSFSIGYHQGRVEGEIGGGNEEEKSAMLSYARALGTGVKWTANLLYADFEDDLNRNSATVKEQNSGFAATTAVRLTF